MRILFIGLLGLALLSCQESTEPSGNKDSDRSTIKLPLYTYDQNTTTATDAKVGDSIVLNADEHSYNKDLDYNWVAWTGESSEKGLAWNSYAFGDNDLNSPQLTFQAPFPGTYGISWCPSDARFECVLHGDLKVTGTLAENASPEVTLYFDESMLVQKLCVTQCVNLLQIDAALKLKPEITDDDDTHFFSWQGYLSGSNKPIISASDISEEALTFTPQTEGMYRFRVSTYDGFLTANGRQNTQNSFSFAARAAENQLPLTSFFLVGQPNVTAAMQFQRDDENNQFYPVIQYYYENTLNLEDCLIPSWCDNEIWHYEQYQNNHKTGDAIPTFSVGDTIEFDGSNSNDPEGETLNYYWGGYIETLGSDTNNQYLNVGENKSTFTLTPTIAGDYYVSLCASESEFSSVYSGNGKMLLPLSRFSYTAHCPQIQIRVTE